MPTGGLQVGSASDVVGAATGLASLVLSIIQRQRLERAEHWPALVAELAGLTAEQIQEVLDDNPPLTELMAQAWLAAAEATADEKRLLLARVVAQAILSPADLPRIDELQFFERAIAGLEPPYLQLLVLIASPGPGLGQLAQTVHEGLWTHHDLEESWPGAGELVLPMMATLQGQGLIEDRGHGSYGGITAWGVTPFGRRLFHFLREEEPAPGPGGASLVLRLAPAGPPNYPRLIVRNLGPAPATGISLTLPTRSSDHGSILVEEEPAPFDIAAEEERAFLLWPFTAVDHPPYRVTARWTDASGPHEVVRELNHQGY